jgi:hypothetical protein
MGLKDITEQLSIMCYKDEAQRDLNWYNQFLELVNGWITAAKQRCKVHLTHLPFPKEREIKDDMEIFANHIQASNFNKANRYVVNIMKIIQEITEKAITECHLI